MKITLALPALVAVCGLALSGTAFVNAQTSTAPDTTAPVMTTTTTAPAPMAKVKKTPYKGSLTAVDTTANTITVQSAKGPLTLTITATTKFKGGKSLADFQVGDAVTGSYTTDATGAMIAASLHKKVPKA